MDDGWEVAKIGGGEVKCIECGHTTSTAHLLPMEAVLFASYLEGWAAAHEHCKKAYRKKKLAELHSEKDPDKI